MIALTSLWLRKNYADSFLVRHICVVILSQLGYLFFVLCCPRSILFLCEGNILGECPNVVCV
uniref:Uncharacterized protein n=1 Tax=Arundo donax TaxID=35708 RepID=A0A0A9GSP5_ARUDO